MERNKARISKLQRALAIELGETSEEVIVPSVHKVLLLPSAPLRQAQQFAA